MSLTPTRRTVLKSGAAAAGAAAALGTSGSLLTDLVRMPRAYGAPPTGRLVVLFLRGAQDGLSAVVPYTETAYYDARPTIAVPADQVLDLDGQFGFHPTMAQLHTLYQANRLAVVVGAANLAGNRSHFTAQDLWEWGAVSAPPDGSGWLGRYLEDSSVGGESDFRGITLGSNVTKSLQGYPALGIAAITEFGLGGQSGTTAGLEGLVRDQYGGGATIEATGVRALDAAASVGGLSGSTANNAITRAFADIAVLLEANLGTEVVTVDISGWDTHNDMGTIATGRMRTLLAALDGYLGTFQADLDARGLTDVTTVVMTEFGRRVAENGTGGTDHGWGSVMMAFGNAINGGAVYGDWPGLAPGVIGARGDVLPTTDFRNVLGDLARDVLGVGDPSSLFPGHTYTPVGISS